MDNKMCTNYTRAGGDDWCSRTLFLEPAEKLNILFFRCGQILSVRRHGRRDDWQPHDTFSNSTADLGVTQVSAAAPPAGVAVSIRKY